MTLIDNKGPLSLTVKIWVILISCVKAGYEGREALRKDVCTCQWYYSYQVGLLFQIKETVINNKLIDSLVSTSINFLSTPTF